MRSLAVGRDGAGLALIFVLGLLIFGTNGAEAISINDTTLTTWFNTTIVYTGGNMKCSSCEAGIPYKPTYACSGVRGGNWNRGVQSFADPIEPGFLLTQLFIKFTGAFHCNLGAANASLQVSMNKFSLPMFQLPTKPTDGCYCPHCVGFFDTPVQSTPGGWPTYNYGGSNTITIIVQNTNVQEICLSEVNIQFGTFRVIPIPDKMLPNAAPLTGGTKILITGTYFRRDIDYRCKYGETYPDPPFATFINVTAVSCMSPEIASAGPVKFKLEPSLTALGSNPINNYTLDFIFFQQPTLEAAVPPAARPGQNVTIRGQNFMPTNSITCSFDGAVVQGHYINETAIWCILPNMNDIQITAIHIAVSLNGVDYAPSTVPFTYRFPAETPWAQISESPYRKWYIIGAVAAGIVVTSLIGFIVYQCRKSRNDRYNLIPGGDLEPGRELQIDIREVTIKEKIGRGSFGDIYLGEWQGVEVAVKKIGFAHMTEKFIHELWREAHLMKNMRHPNMIQLFGVCTEKPEICIVMEYMHRGSLYKILHDPSIDLDWNLRKAMILDAARGMHYLHSSNPIVMHRDFKSHNLLVDSNWRVKVSDFGLSRMIEDQLSATMTVCGTPCWTAPEVLRNQKYSVKADVYSFGIVMWEVCTRMDPYTGVAPFQVVVQVATSGLRPGIPPFCPQAWLELMTECWSENPERRPSFAEIVERLQNLDVSGVPQDFSLSPPPSASVTPMNTDSLPSIRALSGSFFADAGVDSGASAGVPDYGSIQN